jgi:methanogenic corrinoid protein MtbC1
MTVSNDGNVTARNVEVVVIQVRRKVGDGWEQVAEFLPSNLAWTHISQQYMPLLLPRTRKEVELGGY